MTGGCYYQQEDVICLEEYLLKITINLGKAVNYNGEPMVSLLEGIRSVQYRDNMSHQTEK